MKSLILSCMLAFSASATFGQGYQFTEVVTVPATPVKNQAATGTCWCFATTSFMESELLRMGKGTYDLSEMFIVRQKYMNQLQDSKGEETARAFLTGYTADFAGATILRWQEMADEFWKMFARGF